MGGGRGVGLLIAAVHGVGGFGLRTTSGRNTYAKKSGQRDRDVSASIVRFRECWQRSGFRVLGLSGQVTGVWG